MTCDERLIVCNILNLVLCFLCCLMHCLVLESGSEVLGFIFGDIFENGIMFWFSGMLGYRYCKSVCSLLYF